STALPLYAKAVLRAMTKLSAMRERSVVKSSVTASVKFSCAGSPERLLNGKTTSERRCGGLAFLSGGLCGLSWACGEADGAPAFGHGHQKPSATPATRMRLTVITAGREATRRAHPGCARTAVSGVAATAAALIA